jgi:hypothetical protein
MLFLLLLYICSVTHGEDIIQDITHHLDPTERAKIQARLRQDPNKPASCIGTVEIQFLYHIHQSPSQILHLSALFVD